MTDKITLEQRRKNMQAIKSKSKLEDLVARELWKRGIRYKRNVKTLFGKPDIAIQKYRVVIFIDSCFWHSCPVHGNIPKSNVEYWNKKLERNRIRDEEVNDFYKRKNWHILRIWEHEIRDNPDLTIQNIINVISEGKREAVT